MLKLGRELSSTSKAFRCEVQGPEFHETREDDNRYASCSGDVSGVAAG